MRFYSFALKKEGRKEGDRSEEGERENVFNTLCCWHAIKLMAEKHRCPPLLLAQALVLDAHWGHAGPGGQRV